MSGIASLRTQAVLEGVTEAETVFGGQSRSWTAVASLWVDLKPSGVREAEEAGAPPGLVERAEAEARSLAAARRGQRLNAGGPAWRVTAVTANRPRVGRMILHLERRWA
ncbi:MAG TPA: hypothetical protein VF559_05610 [Caulobacteraceae bacterium]